MRTSEALLHLVTAPRSARPAKAPAPEAISGSRLIELRPHSLAWSAIANFSARLGIEPASLLRVIGISERTAIRRRAEGYLKPEEADRLLRVGRIFEEATRILGNEERAAGWLSDPSPVFHNQPPLTFLDSDAGAHEVILELLRIDYGVFA